MRAYHFASAALFAIVGVAHLVRAILAWPMLIDTYAVPVETSYGVFVLCAAMTLWSLRAAGARQP
jgi:hypothetical protein